MRNEAEKNYCNYQPSFTGKGLRIADLAFNSSPDPTVFDEIGVKIPIPMAKESPFDSMPGRYSHAYATSAIIRDMLPDAEIFLLPQINDGLKWIRANNIHIVNASLWNVNADDSEEALTGIDSLLICSAGNTTNSPDEGITAKNPIWTSVTAVHINSNGNLSYPWYSSHGAGAIDLAGMSNLEVRDMVERQYGTSFSSPFVVGLIGQYYDAFNRRMGYFPRPDQAKDFIFNHSKPFLYNRIKEGNGFFKLPDLEEYDFGLQMKIGSTIMNHNGKQVVFDTPPQIINNRTMVPVAALREIGLKVYWDGKNQRIHVDR